jgi:hypothetical protein
MMDPINLPERFLRHIWQHQQFNAENLKTPDGKPVRILFPGTPNVDGGPDFSSARIRVGSTLYRGDVEIHVDAAQWQAHRHDTDPHYNKVILHVVLTSASGDLPATTASRRPIPVLVLHPYIDPTLRSTWIESPPEDHPLACGTGCNPFLA